MDEDLLLSFSDDARPASEECSLLDMNKSLQKQLHVEYLCLADRLEKLVSLRRQLKDFKKKRRKKAWAAIGLKKSEYHSVPAEDTVEEVLSPASREVIAQIEGYLASRGMSFLSIDSKAWKSISVQTNRPVSECISLWHLPQNPHYRQDSFSLEEDAEVLKHQGDWSEVCKTVRRAPISVYMRYLELQKSRPTSLWSKDEDAILKSLVQKEGKESWTEIAAYFKNKTPKQCMYRYKRVLNPEIKHGKWSAEEDAALLEAVQKCRKGNWKQVCKYLSKRTQFQCRERYVYYIDPSIKTEPWTKEEDERLLQAVAQSEKHVWSKIAKGLEGRNDRQCRIRYHRIIKKESDQKREEKNKESECET
ncbi:uncharacterized protein NEMAJ01_0385 [Nematocida major]|uniref:uncharacterized protein n=1 Tax=Nematocida major TaxID=1912982 RepID=UPI0020082781|nr:uncharacterized protein NEMAJ01_0385 [Nematocida major]KAH9385489.1 hypothetical protein NEMAJ01_0385 [Nematocida major]